jgi:hypothetical protein
MAHPGSMRTLKLLPGLLLVALVVPSASLGQATRTWVSGVGDDANPCSRDFPCKTFAGAISKTARGGIINALDDGGFGTVTITKSITIDGGRHIASILSSGTNGVIINITDLVNDPGAKVVLRNLDIAGNSNQGPPATALGVNGVRIIGSTKTVKIHNVAVHDFSQNAVDFKTTNPGVSRLSLTRSDVYDNGGNGIAVAPANGVISVATVRSTDFDGNRCGAAVSQFGIGTSFAGSDCGAGAPNGGNGTAIINAFKSGFADNSNAGVFASGASSLIRLSNNDIMGSTFGLRQINSGLIKSFGNNQVANNSVDGTPDGPNIPSLKIHR